MPEVGMWRCVLRAFRARIAIVPHEIRSMPMMQYPSQCFGKHVRRIDYSREVNQYDVSHKSPMLKCKISDFYMTRAISWSVVIDDLDRRVIVLIDGSGLRLGVAKLMKDEAEILRDLCSSIGSDEFCFSRALRTDGLSARSVCYNSSS